MGAPPRLPQNWSAPKALGGSCSFPELPGNAPRPQPLRQAGRSPVADPAACIPKDHISHHQQPTLPPKQGQVPGRGYQSIVQRRGPSHRAIFSLTPKPLVLLVLRGGRGAVSVDVGRFWQGSKGLSGSALPSHPRAVCSEGPTHHLWPAGRRTPGSLAHCGECLRQHQVNMHWGDPPNRPQQEKQRGGEGVLPAVGFALSPSPAPDTVTGQQPPLSDSALNHLHRQGNGCSRGGPAFQLGARASLV